jgi:hypothetical protein
MQQTIQQRDDARGTGKDFVPFLEGAIGGEDYRLAFVTPVDDFVKQICRLVVEGKIADLVNKCSAEHLSTNVKLSKMWS